MVRTRYVVATASIIFLQLVTKTPPYDLERGFCPPPPLILVPSAHLLHAAVEARGRAGTKRLEQVSYQAGQRPPRV